MTKENFKLDVIPQEAIIKIEISGAFYVRLVQQLLNYIAQNGDQRKLPEILTELKSREPKDPFEYHLITQLILIEALETAAKEQSLIRTQEVKYPDDTPEKPHGN